MLPLKAPFQVCFKEGAFAGVDKHCCPEETYLLDTDTSDILRNSDSALPTGRWRNICCVCVEMVRQMNEGNEIVGGKCNFPKSYLLNTP